MEIHGYGRWAIGRGKADCQMGNASAEGGGECSAAGIAALLLAGMGARPIHQDFL